MDDQTEARRAALRRIVSREGGNTAVAKKYNLSPSRVSYLSQLIARGSTAPFGDRSARNWQDLLGLQGDPLLHPAPLTPENEPEPSVEETIYHLDRLLRAVPADQREVIASVLSAYARKPVEGLRVALTTLLTTRPDDEAP
jgi:hypothetical protein